MEWELTKDTPKLALMVVSIVSSCEKIDAIMAPSSIQMFLPHQQQMCNTQMNWWGDKGNLHVVS